MKNIGIMLVGCLFIILPFITIGQGFPPQPICHDSLVLQRSYYGPLFSSFEYAQTTITSSSLIKNNATVYFRAGDHIDLIDGFHVETGSSFQATNYRCSGFTSNDQNTSNFRVNNTNEKSDISTTTNDEITLRNYPNPFSGGTTIEYTLPQKQYVSLRVSDLSGKTISNLFEDKKHEAGIHTIEFDASQLAPGIYFCTLQTLNSVKTHKITLIE